VSDLVHLYTRPLADKEMVVCADEKTNLQPRPRRASTLPTRPGHPTRLEHGYKRAGALHLFAAFDTRTGKVYARTEVRKRQKEFIALLTQLDREIPPLSNTLSIEYQLFWLPGHWLTPVLREGFIPLLCCYV